MKGLPDPPDQAGVICDLDGTLVDTLSYLTRAVNHAVRETRDTAWTRDPVRPILGEGLSALIARASGMETGPRVGRMIEFFREYYLDHLLGETHLYPGVGALLELLAARRVPLAVPSNAWAGTGRVGGCHRRIRFHSDQKVDGGPCPITNPPGNPRDPDSFSVDAIADRHFGTWIVS